MTIPFYGKISRVCLQWQSVFSTSINSVLPNYVRGMHSSMDPDIMLLVRYIYIYTPLNPIESYEIPVSIHFPHGSSLAPACTTASDIWSFSPDWKMTTAEWTWMHLAWSSTVRAGVLGRRSRRGRSLDIVLYISWIFLDIGAAYTKIAKDDELIWIVQY
jgi:hypothetical protein